MLARNWSPAMRSASTSSSRGEPGLLVGVLRGLEQVERRVRGLRDRADAALEGLLGDADRDVPLDGALDLAGLVRALDLDRAAEHAVRPADRVLEEVRGTEHRVGDAELERLRPFSIRFFLSGFSMIDLERVLDADEVRQQPRAAPARDEAEEDLGQRERRHRRSRSCGSRRSARSRVPPPRARPLMNTNDGTPSSESLPSDWWPSCAICVPVSRSGISPTFERSAPAARMNGLPVTRDARDLACAPREPSSCVEHARELEQGRRARACSGGCGRVRCRA